MDFDLKNCVMPALVTPLSEDGCVKTALAKPLIDMYLQQKADGLYMLGWTGEGAHLSVEKRKEWTKAILDAAKNLLPIFVHVGYNENLQDSIELARHAAEHGAYAVSSVGISEKASLQENIDYFKRISAVSPNTPFYIYWTNMGKMLTGGSEITPSQLLKKMEEVPTFKGIKFTDNNFYILERFKKYSPEIKIFTGADELAICSSIMGADGNIGALQAVTCYHHKMIMEKFSSGDIAGARELQYKANEVAEAYSRSDIGNLPGIKFLLDKIYGLPVGVCSGEGPFAGKMPADAAAQYLVEIFKKTSLLRSNPAYKVLKERVLAYDEYK